MCSEFVLTRMIMRQGSGQRGDPIGYLQGKVRRRRTDHLRKLCFVRNRVVVLEDRHDRDLATGVPAGDRS